MRIRMLESKSGSEDGVRLKDFKAGKEYELEDSPRGRDLGEAFIRYGWAVEASAKPAAPAPEPKKEPEPSPEPPPKTPEPAAVAESAPVVLAEPPEAAPVAPPAPAKQGRRSRGG